MSMVWVRKSVHKRRTPYLEEEHLRGGPATQRMQEDVTMQSTLDAVKY